MQTNITPCLMFQGKAEEALSFYIAHIPNSKMLGIERYGPDESGAEGSVNTAMASLDGLVVRCLDSPVQLKFTFTPSLSLFKTCASQEEIKSLSDLFADGGEVLMPLDNYGFGQNFTWVNDRFGVSWQLLFP